MGAQDEQMLAVCLSPEAAQEPAECLLPIPVLQWLFIDYGYTWEKQNTALYNLNQRTSSWCL